MGDLAARLADYGLTLDEHVVICDRRVVDEAVAALSAASPAPSLPEDVAASAAFLNEAARYFENCPAKGEDRAFWAAVHNAENCRKAAALIQSLSSQLAEARNTAAAWKAEVDRVQNAHKADARLDGDMTLADVIAWLKYHRWTHSDWASWFEQHPDDPRAVKGGVGTAEFHRSVEARYNSMIDCLTAISARAALASLEDRG